MSAGNELILVGAYYFPWLIAVLRKHPNAGGIFILNTFLGWTVIMWFVCFAMACGNAKKAA